MRIVVPKSWAASMSIAVGAYVTSIRNWTMAEEIIHCCRAIRDLHKEAANELEVNRECGAEVEKLLNELQQLLVGISIMQDLTNRARDSLVSFGERLSTRIFAAFLRHQVSTSRQHDPRSEEGYTGCIWSARL